MSAPDNSDDAIEYMQGRLGEFLFSDNLDEYVRILLPIINLLWEQDVGRECGGYYTKDWSINQLRIKIEHGKPS